MAHHKLNTGAVRAFASRLNMANDALRIQATSFSNQALELRGLFHYGDEETKKKVEELFKEMQALWKSMTGSAEKAKSISDQLFEMAQ